MHLLVRDTHALDDDAPAEDLAQPPAPLLALSFSDADLAALAAAWSTALPPLRLASLARLRHPMSIDLYLEHTLAHARCAIIRLLGGLDYWRYGAEQAAALCRARGIALALLPGDVPDDPRLRALSTVDPTTWSALNACFQAAGPGNLALALRWAAHAAALAPRPTASPTPLPAHGVLSLDLADPAPLAAIILYRSHLLSADTAPIAALTHALRAQGLATAALYVDSLKTPATAAYVARTLRAWRPTVILNATAFSARTDAPSPLEAPGVPILQLVVSGATHPAWQASTRGLSPADLAMHAVLPELDGRLGTTPISFKQQAAPHPALHYAPTRHAPHAPGIAQAAASAAAWSRLAHTAPARRRLALILSDYPGIGGQQGHAVGLDTFASLSAILDLLRVAGYDAPPASPAALVAALCHAPPTPFLTLPAYEALLPTLPAPLRAQLHAAWGDPAAEPLTLRHITLGALTIALQPDRGDPAHRRASYHDPDQPPRHAYVAFHLWLRHTLAVHAMVHLGTHGSLEWLPGKAAALSPECWPEALRGPLPVIYPFIVNNPGEAAAAKRRLAAITIGHLTPPLAQSPHHGPAATLERLIDEYAAADGLDRRRTATLRADILAQADSAGLLAESGASRDTQPDDALARLDAYLCDVKDLQLRQGLHIYGHSTSDPTSAAAERAALLSALDARFIPPGPAGAPSRARPDVLPTGRNLTTIDPRAIPTPTAVTLAERAAAALLGRHLAEHGEYPRHLVLNLWGSTTMRTGGEDLALAILLLGARPTWNGASARADGFEITPIALLDRPRIDVTLRISGLFRDAFPAQLALFEALTAALSARDESPDWNPLAGHPGPRIYGPPPGQYGAGDGTAPSWLAHSATAYTRATEGAPDPAGLATRLAQADAFVHTQDHAEQDLLDSPEWAAHEGAFAQAARALGAEPALWHLDTSSPERPLPRPLAQEIRRIVRARAANPVWIAAQMRHGYRGAAEIARPLAALQAFAATLPTRFDPQFDLLFDATLAAPDVDAFLRRENPAAHADLTARFTALRDAGLWHPRRNLPC